MKKEEKTLTQILTKLESGSLSAHQAESMILTPLNDYLSERIKINKSLSIKCGDNYDYCADIFILMKGEINRTIFGLTPIMK